MNFELGTSYKLAPAWGVLNSAREIMNWAQAASLRQRGGTNKVVTAYPSKD